jgi:hypothetical protein
MFDLDGPERLWNEVLNPEIPIDDKSKGRKLT